MLHHTHKKAWTSKYLGKSLRLSYIILSANWKNQKIISQIVGISTFCGQHGDKICYICSTILIFEMAAMPFPCNGLCFVAFIHPNFFCNSYASCSVTYDACAVLLRLRKVKSTLILMVSRCLWFSGERFTNTKTLPSCLLTGIQLKKTLLVKRTVKVELGEFLSCAQSSQQN